MTNMLETLENDSDSEEPINRLRREMSRQCEAFALRPSGIYTLSIPTGGGKTLASLRYALKHAMTFNKDRIIYIVPYTTIIEQNAAEIRGILQEDDMILEHHSNVIEEKMSLRTKTMTCIRKNKVSKRYLGSSDCFHYYGSVSEYLLCERYA